MYHFPLNQRGSAYMNDIFKYSPLKNEFKYIILSCKYFLQSNLIACIFAQIVEFTYMYQNTKLNISNYGGIFSAWLYQVNWICSDNG